MGFDKGNLHRGAALPPAQIHDRYQQQNQPHELLRHRQSEDETARSRGASLNQAEWKESDWLMSDEPVDGQAFAFANQITCQRPNDHRET